MTQVLAASPSPAPTPHEDEDESSKLATSASKFATGLILPPPEIKSVIDKTAGFVAKSANPPQFEEKIRESQRHDPKFSFLNLADPYHAYYRHRLNKVFEGDISENGIPAPKAQTPMQVDEVVSKVKSVGKEPPRPEFMLDLPSVTAIDLQVEFLSDIIKLTALFTARRGRSFLAALSLREGRNDQFEFLRPTHSLFGYFNQLTEQYSKVLLPSPELLERVKLTASEEGRWKILNEAKEHAEWERNRREREQRKEDEKEAERIAFAEIDWHDYAIVQTIEFTTADTTAELPLPMSIQEMESMTLSQKRMAAMIMENTADEIEAHKAKQAVAEREASTIANGIGTMLDEEEAAERRQREEAQRARELERARAIQATSLDATGPMKIRTDYVPKIGGKGTKVAMTTCPVCGQQIPVDELQEHMRIELLDPRWKSQRDALEARKAQASELQQGANVVSSLKHLARTRVDIFGAAADEEKRKQEEEEELARRRERERVVWDGHTATKAGTLDKFQTNVNLDEQIAAIHKSKGLAPIDSAAIGPGIGPSTSLPVPPPSLPMPPQITTTSANQPIPGPPQPGMFPPPMMLPPLHYQPNTVPPYGFQPGPPPPMGVPMGAYPGPTAVVRSADEMMAGDNPDLPPVKRQRVAKLSGGHLYPEQDWINMHPIPISIMVQLPTIPENPEWKLDGSLVTVPDLPVTLLISTLRERIIRHIDSPLSLGRVRLSYSGKLLSNQQTMASYNLEDGETLVVDIQKTKKR
ncbi:hypothetical protein Clacol_006449 [Clathrus columnatus]|uniref:Splicing factor 3A subunit 1 n=1 Tax=Clathrus columnatus TaxID=1419009 RepID=A0AAV5AHP4_9AGAM|nr:hypothetical protein Clacol_006449 [Clathrus columnatus]